MFFSLILENSDGDQINMTTTANQYMTSKIEGLSPPPGTISTSSYAGMDGSYLRKPCITGIQWCRAYLIFLYNRTGCRFFDALRNRF